MPLAIARFEAAADAVVTGDTTTLGQFLRDDPELVQARSARPHHATLLHYVSANGVEDDRQVTPSNAVEIATMLLDAHAEVDAPADTYGGGPQQTTLNLLASSVHPARAGLQVPLVHALLDFGAAVDGVQKDDSPLLTALAFQYPDAARALATRGARVDTILAAAGLGREDLVRRLVDTNGKLSPGARLSPVPKLSQEPKAHLERALIWAATFGHAPIVDFLTQHYVDISATDGQGFTALHWAAFRGHLDVIDVLLRHRAPLEATNRYGGTVLDMTVWAAAHVDGVFQDGGFGHVDYVPVVERLLAAGARVDVLRRASGRRAVDAILAEHGAQFLGTSG
jgi:hypothetical protein